MSTFTRRHLLGAIGATGMGAIAGCSDGSAEGSSGTVLASATVQNLHEEPHTIDVLVQFEDEIEHWSTHDLEGRSGDNAADLDVTWPSAAGEFRVTARLDGSTLVQRTPADWNDLDCLKLQIQAGQDAGLDIWGVPDDENCDATGSSDGNEG